MNRTAAKMLYEFEEDRDVVLVVIVDQDDSAPRGSGSFMLVGKHGRMLGTIGGGAVEKRSEELALQCLAEKKSLLHEYHLNTNEIEDIGMVCGGDVKVLFQYIASDDKAWGNVIRAVLKRYEERKDFIFALNINGTEPSLIDENGRVFAGKEITSGFTGGNTYQLAGEIFYMPVSTGERAIIFGAGHCGAALAPILDSVGFRVTIYDNREEFANRENVPCAEKIICGDYKKISEHLEFDPGDYVVIMTSGHSFDFEVEQQALSQPVAYVGVVGSAKKTASVNKRLMDAGISREAVNSIFTPIGTPIKAVTPEEIAVSIAGEMIRVRANRRLGIEDKPTHMPVH